MIKFQHLIYLSFSVLLSCSDAAKEASEIRTYSIDISVTGLDDGENIQITESKSGASKTISANRLFTLSNFYFGDTFSIAITTSPKNKLCTISNGTGLISGSSANNVNITCVKLFSVSGNITGLKSDNLVLKLNLNDELPISTDGRFAFDASLTTESTYLVSVLNQPSDPNQFCTVKNGSGAIKEINILDVDVSCITNSYTIGGTITGLVGNELILGIKSENLTVSTTDSTGFSAASTSLIDGSPYTVSVTNQPTNPAQTCTVSNDSGVIKGANISDVQVTCTIIINNAFSSPRSLVLDAGEAGNNRILVADEVAIIAVDLASGIRTVLSNNSIPNANNPFSSLRGITLDTVKNRVLVVDQTQGIVFAVDLTTGSRTVLSDQTTPNTNNALTFPISIVLDPINNRALVADFSLSAVIAVNLDTGARTILSNNTIPNTNNPLSWLRDITLDSANNRLLVLMEDPLDTIMALDLETGARSVLSTNIIGGTPNTPFPAPRGITLNAATNQALVVDETLDAIISVDLNSGNNFGLRTILSDNTTPIPFSAPTDIIYDLINQQLLIVDTSLAAIISFDLTMGERSILSDTNTP